MIMIGYQIGAFSYIRIVRMIAKISAGEFAIPGPVVFGIRSGMNSDKPSSRLNKSFKIILLLLI